MNKCVTIILALVLGLAANTTAGTILLQGVGGPRPAASAPPAGFANAKSIEFDDAASSFFSMANADFGAYDTAKFAISLWFQRLELVSNTTGIMGHYGFGGGRAFRLRFLDADNISFGVSENGTNLAGEQVTTATFGVDSTWHHLLIWYDSANATAGDRMRMWIDGSEVTAFDTDTNPAAAAASVTSPITIGAVNTLGDELDGYLDEIAFFSGSLPAVTDVRDSSTGKPKDLTSLTGLKSWIRSTDSGTLVSDEVLSADWTNNNTATESTSVP